MNVSVYNRIIQGIFTACQDTDMLV